MVYVSLVEKLHFDLGQRSRSPRFEPNPGWPIRAFAWSICLCALSLTYVNEVP